LAYGYSFTTENGKVCIAAREITQKWAFAPCGMVVIMRIGLEILASVYSLVHWDAIF
jgi:hypothetical protein